MSKRKVSNRTSKPTIIVISDSEDDISETPKRRKRIIKESNSCLTEQTKNETPKRPDKKIQTATRQSRGVDETAANTSRNSFWGRRRVLTIPELLADQQGIDTDLAHNITQLFDKENTVPFICRYRRDLVNHMQPAELRQIKNRFEEITQLRNSANTIAQKLLNKNLINEEIHQDILCAKTTEELEHLVAPYKLENKGTRCNRAKELGLELHAMRLLHGEAPALQLEDLVMTNKHELDSADKVERGLCDIIAHIIAKDTSVLDELQNLRFAHRIMLDCKQANQDKKPDLKQKRANHFKNYYDFTKDVRNVSAHQFLAMQRGEKAGQLKTKIIVPTQLKDNLLQHANRQFMSEGITYSLRTSLFLKSFNECYTKNLQPLLKRQITRWMKERAVNNSIDFFSRNLRQMLLQKPYKGETIVGIDPGYTNGCKYAVISKTGELLEFGIFSINVRDNEYEQGARFGKVLAKFNCNTIALGDGCGSSQTERWIANHIHRGVYGLSTVRYSKVPEVGASVYSCSELAKKEFPDLDPLYIGAVSIARRLMDPLSEYIKADPKNLGIGNYQHDIDEKKLKECSLEVISEIVSYLGVDVNTASVTLLKHVAGLSDKKAQKIIDYRTKHGPFKKRSDLLKVPTIGSKTFEQCAGFIRLEPLSACDGRSLENPLDCTWVHPESYDLAKEIMKKCGLNICHIGEETFIQRIQEFENGDELHDMAKRTKTPTEKLKIVLDALKRQPNKDDRLDIGPPVMMRTSLAHPKDIVAGSTVRGRVNNVVEYGAFVDIGAADTQGLLHNNEMNGVSLKYGDQVICVVIKNENNSIALRLKQVDVCI